MWPLGPFVSTRREINFKHNSTSCDKSKNSIKMTIDIKKRKEKVFRLTDNISRVNIFAFSPSLSFCTESIFCYIQVSLGT